MDVSIAFNFLNIAENASLEEVNASYRRLLLQYHPDKNKDRSTWSHQMTIRLTEAFTAVSAYLQNSPQETIETTKQEEEPDSGYSLAMQTRIGRLYDLLLEHIHRYYTSGMNKLHLREEGTLRQHYRATLYRFSQTMQELQSTQNWSGSIVQHRQVRIISDFAVAFYANMRIKPKEKIFTGKYEQRAEKLYRVGASALDTLVSRSILDLEFKHGLICPDSRYQVEQSFMLLLSKYSESSYAPEAMIKIYLLKSLSALCEQLESYF